MAQIQKAYGCMVLKDGHTYDDIVYIRLSKGGKIKIRVNKKKQFAYTCKDTIKSMSLYTIKRSVKDDKVDEFEISYRIMRNLTNRFGGSAQTIAPKTLNKTPNKPRLELKNMASNTQEQRYLALKKKWALIKKNILISTNETPKRKVLCIRDQSVEEAKKQRDIEDNGLMQKALKEVRDMKALQQMGKALNTLPKARKPKKTTKKLKTKAERTNEKLAKAIKKDPLGLPILEKTPKKTKKKPKTVRKSTKKSNSKKLVVRGNSSKTMATKKNRDRIREEMKHVYKQPKTEAQTRRLSELNIELASTMV